MKVGDLVVKRYSDSIYNGLKGLVTTIRKEEVHTWYLVAWVNPENGSSWCIDREVEVISESR